MSTNATPSRTSPTGGEAALERSLSPSKVGYHLRTALLGLIGLPVIVSVVTVILAGAMTGRLASGITALVSAVVVAFGLLWWWGRGPGRPDSLGRAALPVVIAPAYYLSAWIICMALAGNLPAGALQRFALPGSPWFLVNLSASLTGREAAVPILLSGVLVAGTAGFVVGYRGRHRRMGAGARGGIRGSVMVGLVVCALIGTAGGQYLAAERYTNAATVSDEVDLTRYTPFDPDNLLVVPANPPSLRIASGFPRLDGATALYPVYAAAAEALYDVADMSESSREDLVKRVVPCSGTGEAYNRLAAGQVDVIFVAQPSEGQLARLGATGQELTLTALGREAFVFFVNADNPVEGLTQQQIRDIYTATVTNWRELGGRDQTITAYQRPEGSGSQTAMLAEVMRGVPMAEARREELIDGMGGVLSRVATYRNLDSAIGYSFRWYATVMNPKAGIKLLAVDGIAPTPETIRDGSYPLAGDFYAITLGRPSPGTAALIGWLASPEGQALVEQVGYVGR